MESKVRALRLQALSALFVSLALTSCSKVGFPRVDEVAARLTGTPLLERYGSGRSSGRGATRPSRRRGDTGTPGEGGGTPTLTPGEISRVVGDCMGGEGAPRVPRGAVTSFEALYRLAAPASSVNPDLSTVTTAAYYRGVREIARRLRSCLRRGNEFDKMRWVSYMERQLTLQQNRDPVGIEEALGRLLAMLGVEEGSSAESRITHDFLEAMVRFADPFARLVPLGADADSFLLAPQGEAAVASLEVVEPGEGETGAVAVATARTWETGSSESFRDLLRLLESRAAGLPIVLDLRSAAGSDPALLEEARSSAAAGWGGGPIVVWVDSQTRGAPEAFVSELEARGNVLVVGSPTAGYARASTRAAAELGAGADAFELEIGTVSLLAEGFVAPVQADVPAPATRLSREERERLREAGIALFPSATIHRAAVPLVASPSPDAAPEAPASESDEARTPSPLEEIRALFSDLVIPDDAAVRSRVIRAARIWASTSPSR